MAALPACYTQLASEEISHSVAALPAYIQSIPLAPINGYKLWVASSTVSLKASLGLCPLSRSTSYCARNMPCIPPGGFNHQHIAKASRISREESYPSSSPFPLYYLLKTYIKLFRLFKLTIKIRVDFLLERSLVHVPTSDCYTERNSLFFSFAGNILVYGDGRVDPSAFAEQRSDCATGAFWCDKNDVDILWYVDVGKILENWGEAMGEVQRLEVLLMSLFFFLSCTFCTLSLVN